MSAPRGWKSAYAANKAKRVRRSLAKRRLSAPITPERITTFTSHLLSVSFGSESECWLYVGCGKGTTFSEDLKIKTTTYANMKFNGETVGPHRFAVAAAEGVTLAELAGFDIHHAPEHGRCIGYRCCNPDHLEKTEKVREHRGGRGDRDSLIRYQTKTVQEVTGVPVSERRPTEHLMVTGAGSRRRFLGGTPFLIRGGVLVGLDASDPRQCCTNDQSTTIPRAT